MLAKVEQIHEFTGLREFADMPLKYYSSGMYMRLAFAIATEVNPDILLDRRVAGRRRCRLSRESQGPDSRSARPDARRRPRLSRS